MKSRSIIAALLLLSILLVPGLVLAAPGDCDGTTDNDSVLCMTTPSNPDNNIDLDLGDDVLMIENGVTTQFISGDSIPGGGQPTSVGGNDTIFNNGPTFIISGDGVLNADGGDDMIVMAGSATAQIVAGDLITITGSGTYQGGDDTIHNHVTLTGAISGDALLNIGSANIPTLIGGNDTIDNLGTAVAPSGETIAIGGDDIRGTGGADVMTNSGTANGSIAGDNAYVGGTDNITNTGIVTGSILGDYLTEPNCTISCTPTGGGAGDTITNGGRVDGSILAEGGNDRVIIWTGTNGGSDNQLQIDGGSGTDILKFELGAGSTLLNLTGTPASGSVTLDGQTLSWTNFETLEGIDNAVSSELELTAPLGAITTPQGNPTYTWSDTGASSYNIAVWKADYSSMVYYGQNLSDATYCTGGTCSIEPTTQPTLNETARLVNGSYAVWLCSENCTTGASWKGPFSFTLNAPAPQRVTNVTYTGTDTLRPMINWTTSDNTTYHYLYVAPMNNFGSPVVNGYFTRTQTCGSLSATNCNLQMPVDLAEGVQYGGYVLAVGSGGFSMGGPYNNGYEGGTFTPNLPNPPIPTNVTAAPNWGRPTISWATDASSTHHNVAILQWPSGSLVWFKQYPKSGDPALNCTPALCMLLDDGIILGNGSYSVYVNAVGAGGASDGGAFGNGYAGPANPNVTTEAGDFVYVFQPPRLVNALNANGGGNTVNISFMGVEGATWYLVWVGTEDAAQTYYYAWHSSTSLGCQNMGICIAPLTMMYGAIPAGSEYYVAVQSAGPGGYSVGGPVNNGFQVSSVITAP
jgi:hypothetical protein